MLFRFRHFLTFFAHIDDMGHFSDEEGEAFRESQKIIDILIKKYIATGGFRAREFEEIKQQINTRLIDGRLKRILELFDGRTKLSTFLSVCINNICLEMIRRPKPDPPREDLEKAPLPHLDKDEWEIQQEIERDVRRLGYILETYPKTKSKILLCLKITYRIAVIEEDIKAYCPRILKEHLTLFLKNFGNNKKMLKDKEIYPLIIPVFNRCESTETSADSLRRWVSARIQDLTKLINRTNRRHYDKETFGMLLERSFLRA